MNEERQTDTRDRIREIPPKIAGGPGRYIQGVGALEMLGRIVRENGEKPLIVSDDIVWSILGDRVNQILEASGIQAVVARFGGESSHAEIDRITTICRESGCNVAIGLGGGKALDTAKAVAMGLTLPVIIAPTIASNDAPTSRVIVIYNEEGALVEIQRTPRNPDVILVDTGVIAQAPVRFLVAGMGDALPTKFEAEQSAASGSLNLYQGRPTHSSLVLADTCYQLIRQYGLMARNAVNRHLVTEAVELVVEANIFLSGAGFENGGLAAAHAMTRGFSVIPELHGCLHGEEVAFGLLVQLILENRSREYLDDMYAFYRSIGLPSTLADLGVLQVSEDHLRIIAERTCAEGSHIYNMTVPVNERSLIDAIQLADALGSATGC